MSHKAVVRRPFLWRPSIPSGSCLTALYAESNDETTMIASKITAATITNPAVMPAVIPIPS